MKERGDDLVKILNAMGNSQRLWIMEVTRAKVQADAFTGHTMMVRSLAEEATVAQRTTATELTEVRMAMIDIRDHLAAIERMMSAVG